MGRTPTQLRVWAVIAYFCARGNLAAAVRLFKTGTDSDGRAVEHYQAEAQDVSDARNYVQRWSGAFAQSGTVTDAPGRGRKPKVPHAALVMAADAFKAGFCDDSGTVHYYTSIQEALDGPMAHPYLVDLRQRFDVSDGYHTLLLRMREVDPDLTQAKRSAKHKFTPAQKQKRIEYCQMWLEKEFQAMELELLATVWIDAKKGYTEYNKESVWTSRSATHEPDFHMDPERYGKTALNFYIAVNALIGPVSIVFVSGTTGLPKIYKVGIWDGGGVNLVECITQSLSPPARARCIAFSTHTLEKHMSL
jgi:hypothetical protein